MERDPSPENQRGIQMSKELPKDAKKKVNIYDILKKKKRRGKQNPSIEVLSGFYTLCQKMLNIEINEIWSLKRRRKN